MMNTTEVSLTLEEFLFLEENMSGAIEHAMEILDVCACAFFSSNPKVFESMKQYGVYVFVYVHIYVKIVLQNSSAGCLVILCPV